MTIYLEDCYGCLRTWTLNFSYAIINAYRWIIFYTICLHYREKTHKIIDKKLNDGILKKDCSLWFSVWLCNWQINGITFGCKRTSTYQESHFWIGHLIPGSPVVKEWKAICIRASAISMGASLWPQSSQEPANVLWSTYLQVFVSCYTYVFPKGYIW